METKQREWPERYKVTIHNISGVRQGIERGVAANRRKQALLSPLAKLCVGQINR
jgi:hypothetical protein